MINMNLPEEQEERGMGIPVVYTILGVSAFVLIILAVVLFSSKEKNPPVARNKTLLQSPSPAPTADMEFAEGQQDIEALYRNHQLRSEDLDFWNMYQNDEPLVEAAAEESPIPTASPEPTQEELAKDGRHTMVTLRDGTQELQEISEDIPLYTYDFTNLKMTNNKMAYYIDGEKKSWLGVELSSENGKVNFKDLKDNGVDFVMIRLGTRGYESGLLALDDNFVTNITEAANAGLEIGITFFSQAVNVEEAVAEAEFVISNLIPYKITYPVAFKMEYIANDESRIDSVNKDKKTQITEAFLSTIEQEGYHSILYGNKSWLLSELIPQRLLAEYDVWLTDQAPIPDYPYQFRLWKYAINQEVIGIEKKADYIVSFVDYTRK